MATLNSASMKPETAELFAQYVVPNYTRFPVSLVRGEGSYVWDDQGRRYLDFFPGWGCNLLGHCPPRVVEAIQQQAAELIHVPNTWHTEAQGRWAQLLSERSFGGKAFFCNSGAEANEAAIKLARLHAPDGRYKIITFRGGFHGRTYGATSATAQPKYHEGIGPLLAGFVYAPYGDLDAVRKLVDERNLRDSGRADPGRRRHSHSAGRFFGGPARAGRRARPAADVRRSAMRLRPDGQVVRVPALGRDARCHDARQESVRRRRGRGAADDGRNRASLRPGMHAATFGGNPIAARAGIATLETIEEEGLLERATQLGERFRQRLAPLVDELRDRQGAARVRTDDRARACRRWVADRAANAWIAACLINCTQQTVIRLLPAMTLERRIKSTKDVRSWRMYSKNQLDEQALGGS